MSPWSEYWTPVQMVSLAYPRIAAHTSKGALASLTNVNTSTSSAVDEVCIAARRHGTRKETKRAYHS